jgi:iron complex transport system substrate-binding protein
MKIVSFLPSATEMVCVLGLADQLVGISHECDFPEAIRMKPVVVRNAVPLEGMSPREIDVAVSQRLRSGASLYQVDEKLMRQLAPDLILTQNLCAVCAPSGNEVSQIVNALPKPPNILYLTPKSLAEIDGNLRDVARATGRLKDAEDCIASGRARLEQIASLTNSLSERPRVFCMEWVDPVYCSGHWVPEMIELAGGRDELARKGTDSVRIPWEDVLKWDPEILIVNPCGFNLRGALEQASRLFSNPGWGGLSAVREGRVYAVNANAYFARPGPRVVEGVEILAHLFHPEVFPWDGRPDAFSKIL